jgi:hypothetical protein
VKVAVLALALAALVSGCGGSGDGELAVTQATLEPGAIPPGDVEAFVVPYHWIAGESYEIRLLLSTGHTVDFEIEDAESA